MNSISENKLKTLEYSSIRPKGWILDQLQLQMDGITKDLDKYWGSVGSYSDWIGGTDNSWERPPYWLDGLVPLSFLLKDEEGIEKSKKWIEWSLNSQKDNGDFGPSYRKTDFDETLFWPKFVMLKVFVSYYESTKDPRVIPFMTKYFKFSLEKLNEYKMNGWAEARGGDLAYSILWLYEKTNDEFLLQLLKKVNDQTLVWGDMFENFPFTKKTDFYYKWDKIWGNTTRTSLYSVMQYHYTHIVNVTMGIKQPLMKYRETGEETYLESVYDGIQSLSKYHGQVAGVFAGDEHLNGTNPTQGTELCSVVEYMFSLQLLLEATGDSIFGDLIERVAYNALPATISEDFKSHQYDQQANQVIVSHAKRNWYNNEDDSNLFGFEPNFGCCLANMHQGWPKFTKNAFMVGKNSIHAAVYMPLEANVELKGKNIKIVSKTEYPFNGEVNFAFELNGSEDFKFNLRIPGWCNKYSIFVNDEPVDIEDHNGWAVLARVFNDNDKVSIIFEMPVFIKKGWYNNGVTVERGPLVFGLNIKENWKKLSRGISDYPYYEIYPESPWNYALEINKEMNIEEKGITTKQAFSYNHPPVRIFAKAFSAASWGLEDNSAGDLPLSPVACVGEEETVELIPYGCAKLRISLFPWIE
ncbi:MAG: glycoside hydrolase family 127 protein [Bacillota bacterium]|nr:glycoside hydrolase family 127 protein [Bacillota bacterium]